MLEHFIRRTIVSRLAIMNRLAADIADILC